VGRARDKAVEDRKKRLLQEYQSSKKSNSFQDKRFGEQDTTMSLEEKMFVRFQKERLKKARNASIFNLDSGAGQDTLTHKGKILGEGGSYNDDDGSSDDEEDDKSLGRDVVSQLHFGGGLIPKKVPTNSSADGDQDQQQPQQQARGRLEALQEIVMKSKLHKLEKKEAKDEQENERVELDKAFEDLIASSVVQFRPTKRSRGADDDDVVGDGSGGAFAEYDKALHAMAFEAKAKASDRTKTVEELAVEEKQRLEEAEAARRKRMRGALEAVGGDEAATALSSGKVKGKGKGKDKGRKGDAKRRRTDDDLDDEEEEKGDKPGDIVTNNYGWDDVENGSDEEEEEEEEEDDDEEDEDEEDEEQEEKAEDDEEEDEEEEDDEEEDSGKRSRHRRTKAPAPEEGVNALMPHIVPCPVSLEDFDSLAAKYVLSGADLCALLSRIVSYHSVHLPAPEGPQNRLRMNGFLDVLLKIFARAGDALGGQDSLLGTQNTFGDDEASAVLDHCSGLVYRLCKDLPEVAPSVWSKALRAMQQLLQSRLRDFSEGKRAGSCWPSLGRLLLLKLASRVFSASDNRHAIVAPASMLLCQYLTQCPVSSATDLASGIMAAATLLDLTADSGLLVPEALAFVSSVVRLYAPSSAPEASKISRPLGTFDRARLAALREAASDRHDFNTPCTKVAWRFFSTKHGGAGKGFTPELARGILGSALTLATAIAERHASSPALPELLLPLLDSLRAVQPSAAPALPPSSSSLLNSVLVAAASGASKQQSSRRPLQWRKEDKAASALETKAPKFQLNYTFKKDQDPDADRAKLKQLNRQRTREHKAAMRELRRDGEFLDREQFREKSSAAEERRNERAKNFAFMEQQQAHINEQVRKGGSLLKGGGSGVVPKQVRSKADRKRKGK
jgi:nucleolar protein 14